MRWITVTREADRTDLLRRGASGIAMRGESDAGALFAAPRCSSEDFDAAALSV
jgi:hypothetical protein